MDQKLRWSRDCFLSSLREVLDIIVLKQFSPAYDLNPNPGQFFFLQILTNSKDLIKSKVFELRKIYKL